MQSLIQYNNIFKLFNLSFPELSYPATELEFVYSTTELVLLTQLEEDQIINSVYLVLSIQASIHRNVYFQAITWSLKV
jgi:hypothetical protein